jgi:hypothetical protein
VARQSSSRIFAGAAIALALVFAFLAWGPSLRTGGGATGPGGGAAAGDDADGSSARSAAGRRAERPLGKDPAVADAETVEYLRELFGQTINNKRTQIKAIEKLLEYLMKNYPDDWKQRVQALLAQAFPGMADQLYAAYQNMTAYNDWLRAHQEELSQMDPRDKRAALRAAQQQFFGADAAEIWEESLRHDRIFDAMDAINQATDLTVDDKLKTYLGAINETYGQEAPAFLDKRQTELMTNFLTLPSVQADLQEMSPASREQQLDQIRAAMGMDEEARQRWKDLDSARNEAWDEGQDYMQKRDEIVKSVPADQQAARLDDLRRQFFGDQADIVRSEEDSGFFRFGHTRVYGRE